MSDGDQKFSGLSAVATIAIQQPQPASVEAITWGELGKFRPKDPTPLEACLLAAMFTALLCPSFNGWDLTGYVRAHGLERHFEKEPHVRG